MANRPVRHGQVSSHRGEYHWLYCLTATQRPIQQPNFSEPRYTHVKQKQNIREGHLNYSEMEQTIPNVAYCIEDHRFGHLFGTPTHDQRRSVATAEAG